MTHDDLLGHVSDSFDTWEYDLGPAVVRKCSVGPMDNNAYTVTCRSTGAVLLVDAAAEPGRLTELLAMSSRGSAPGRSPSSPLQVLTTHRHADHHGALAELVRSTGATTLAGEADAPELPVPVDLPLTDGDVVGVGDLVLDVIGLRGHTPGSVALALTVAGDRVRTVLLTGDSLFPGGPGKTWSAGDFDQLMDDLEERVFAVFADETLVLPGHGDNTTLGTERTHLGEWRERGW